MATDKELKKSCIKNFPCEIAMVNEDFSAMIGAIDCSHSELAFSHFVKVFSSTRNRERLRER